MGALTLATCQLWSLALAGAARAVTLRPPVDPGHTRALTADEMRHITGAGGGGGIAQPAHQISVAAESGGTYPWESSVGGTNTGNGDKLTTLPLVGWTARCGLPVSFALSHNSQSNHNSELGHKWTFSYDLYLAQGEDGPIVHWGDDLANAYVQNPDGSFTAPRGIHDAMAQNVDGTVTLTRPDQTRYHFTTGGYCDSITDENGNALTITRNGGGFVTGVTDANGRAVTLGYDSSSRIHTVTDPLGRVWTITYDANSALTRVAFPAVGGAAYSVSYGYDSAYDITSVTDPRGSARSLGYNGDGSLAWEQDNAGSRTSYAYASSGTTVTDANGHATAYAYASGLVSRVTDAAGQSDQYAYDASNNRTQVTDRRGNTWKYTYNGAGDQLTATDPLNHTTATTYNGHHRPLTKTLPGGEGVAYTYDGADNLTQTQEKNSGGTVLAASIYTVGAYGLVSAKTDADGHATTYSYDTNGDLASVTTPLGNQTQWGHDALGAVTSRTDAMGRTTAYTLDAWERTTTATYPDSSVKTFTYDAASNLTQFTDGTGTTTQTYDMDSRLTGESKGGVVVVSHTYDAAGQKGLLSTTTDSGGRTITYSYTSRDLFDTVSESAGTATYAYNATGEQTGVTNANGTTVTDVYDAAGRLTGVTNATLGGTVLSSFAYTYNSDGLKTSCTEANGDVVSYGYDGLLHLSSESRTGMNAYSNTYTVDGIGNRTSQTVGGTSTSFTYDADDELLSTNGGLINTYAYNANGDQTGRTIGGVTTALAFDYDDQMTVAGEAKFTYDAGGRRASRMAGGTTTTYQYDSGSVLMEREGGSTTASYTYGNALLRKDGETPLFDGLGSERTVTNSGGSVTASLTTSAFGGAVASSGTSASAYRFGATSGYRSDGDAGLIWVGCRYYDPQVGRFTSRDTDLTQMAYVYCYGDPVNFVDADGHCPKRSHPHPKPRPQPAPVTNITIVVNGGSPNITVGPNSPVTVVNHPSPPPPPTPKPTPEPAPEPGKGKDGENPVATGIGEGVGETIVKGIIWIITHEGPEL